MPYPIYSKLADAYITILRAERVMSTSTEEEIRTLIRSLPARVTLDLLSHVGMFIETYMRADSMAAEWRITHCRTPYQDFFLVILNQIRVFLGYESWFPEKSYLMDESIANLTRMYNLEVDNGILPGELANLRELTEDIVARATQVCDNEDDEDDASSVFSGASSSSGVTDLESMMDEARREVMDRVNDPWYWPTYTFTEEALREMIGRVNDPLRC